MNQELTEVEIGDGVSVYSTSSGIMISKREAQIFLDAAAVNRLFAYMIKIGMNIVIDGSNLGEEK